MSEARLMQGNEACVEGALVAGVNFFGGYPCTPPTEIAELMAKRLPALGGTFMQMEDEIVGIAVMLGVVLGGSKGLATSSGPGFSLKQELIGYGCMVEIPIVIVDFQRVGPSTGQPTLPRLLIMMNFIWKMLNMKLGGYKNAHFFTHTRK